MGLQEKKFSFENIAHQFREVLSNGYDVLTCAEYVSQKNRLTRPCTLINRVDIDLSPKKAKRLAQIFNGLGIRATFFVRLHANEYNPFSFQNLPCLQYLRDSGHEIGYHAEIVEESAIFGEDPISCLKTDLEILGRILKTEIKGVASHRGYTGLNNLDFWKEHKPQDFGLLYEGYDTEPAFNLFQEALYVSDSEWYQWKCYDRGALRKDDRRSLAEHSRTKAPLIYSLIHPDTYYDDHFYE